MYSQALADEIVNRMINGESVLEIARSEHMPDRVTLHRWMASMPEFATRIAEARASQADHMDDLVYEVGKTVTEETSRSASVKITAFRWRAEHLQPRKYNRQYLDMNLSGYVASDNTELLEKLTPEERGELREILMRAAQREAQPGKQIEGVVRRK